ncbi:MAG: hydroxyacid dehydrogenase, partial [Candidatus Kerfeldbacteria bacterium]|nr:hydroxyacid dehydrogenase [Candidatus Kerfeldbacteria bacterium]
MEKNIVGVELEPWQTESMRAKLPGMACLAGGLESITSPAEVEVLTTFIYTKITAAALERMPKLKFIATRSTGFDHIDLEACRQRGIKVANVPSYGENTVAEQAFALLLALTRKIVPSVEQTRRNDFSVDELQGVDLAKKTIGVIGTGRIGQHAIRMAKGFGMDVLAYDPFPKPELATEIGFTYADLDELLAKSDMVTLHAPATKETFHLLDERRLRLMKPTAFLINTARGSLIDTQALARVL